jgi:hypothetical protein
MAKHLKLFAASNGEQSLRARRLRRTKSEANALAGLQTVLIDVIDNVPITYLSLKN